MSLATRAEVRYFTYASTGVCVAGAPAAGTATTTLEPTSKAATSSAERLDIWSVLNRGWSRVPARASGAGDGEPGSVAGDVAAAAGHDDPVFDLGAFGGCLDGVGDFAGGGGVVRAEGDGAGGELLQVGLAVGVAGRDGGGEVDVAAGRGAGVVECLCDAVRDPDAGGRGDRGVVGVAGVAQLVVVA